MARQPWRRGWRGLIQVLAGPDAPPAWWHPPWPRRAYLALSLATLALFVLNLASIHTEPTATPAPATSCRASPCYYFHYPPLSAGQLLLVIAVVAPLLLAARYPLLGWRIAWLALLLAPLAPAQWRGGWPWGPAQVLVLLVLFCVAAVRYGRPVLWWMWALSLIPWWLWLVRDLPDLNGPISATILFTAATIAVDSISSRWRTERTLAVQTERTELERERRAVLEERTRIARELHDVVAHHLSLIAVQAETAPYRLSDLPESARAEFGSLSGAAREALTEMRRLLGVLRYDQPAGLAPQPQLSDLPALVDAARLRRGVGRAGRTSGDGRRAFRRWAVRVPDCAGIAVQCQPARARSGGQRVGGPRCRGGPAAGGQRAGRGRRPFPERTPVWSWADRDA